MPEVIQQPTGSRRAREPGFPHDPEVEARYQRLKIPPAPAWSDCGEDDYGSVERDRETFVRWHGTRIAEHVDIAQCESNRDNVITLDPPVIGVHEVVLDDLKNLDPAGARRLAQALVAAADRYEEIVAAQS